MWVTICSTIPSNDPEIHVAGCADIKRQIKRGVYDRHPYDIDVTSERDVVEEYWADILAEESSSYESCYAYTKFLPCTRELA